MQGNLAISSALDFGCACLGILYKFGLGRVVVEVMRGWQRLVVVRGSGNCKVVCISSKKCLFTRSSCECSQFAFPQTDAKYALYRPIALYASERATNNDVFEIAADKDIL